MGEARWDRKARAKGFSRVSWGVSLFRSTGRREVWLESQQKKGVWGREEEPMMHHEVLYANCQACWDHEGEYMIG